MKKIMAITTTLALLVSFTLLSLSVACTPGDLARALEKENQREETEEPKGKGDVILYQGRMTDEPNGSYRAYRVELTVRGGERGIVPFEITVWTDTGGQVLDGITESMVKKEYSPFLEVGQEESIEFRFWVRENLLEGEAAGLKTHVKVEALRPYNATEPEGEVEIVVYQGRMTDEMYIDNTDEAYRAYRVSYTVRGIERGKVTLKITVRADEGMVLYGDTSIATESTSDSRVDYEILFLERGEESTGEVLFWVQENLQPGWALGSTTSVEIKATK
jgi:hypothetical protein